MKPRFRQCLFSAVVVAGCSESEATRPVVCTDDFRPGLVVYVRDARTNAGIASGASLVAREGLFKDSVAFAGSSSEMNDFPLAAAGERAGTYQVTVAKPGYAKWTQSNVSVTSGACHVITVTLTALLQPSP